MMDYLRETEGKSFHDPLNKKVAISSRCVWVPGAIVVGGGPSGLAIAACLKSKGLPSLIVERANCIASLWQFNTYDRLCLHLPKHFCELPLMPFPSDFPTYPTKQQFLTYLERYVAHFGLDPVFNQTVVSAEFNEGSGFWRVKTVGGLKKDEANEFVGQWLIVATGENAEPHVPQIAGLSKFRGEVVHSSKYKNGEMYRDKRVLVVGCGNSGMEVCLDLCNYNATPSIVIRDSVHVLPQEMLGQSTFGLSMWLLKWFPVSFVDQFLLLLSHFLIGDTSRLGLNRPNIGPLRLKNLTGKTPVLDVGTLSKIKSGDIMVFPGIKRVTQNEVEFVDGRIENFDAIILATGYKSNVPSWLKETKMFSKKDGFPSGWKGENGLYAVGFSKRGLLGVSKEAMMIAEDLELLWKSEAPSFMGIPRASSPLHHQ